MKLGRQMRVQVFVAVIAMAAAAGAATWITDFGSAKRMATEKNLPVLIYFSGSDWCGWCRKLDSEVLSQDPFAAFARDNLVLLLADFPQAKKQEPGIVAQNEALSKTFAIEGFPTLVLVDASGKELARTGYRPGGAAAYVEHLKELIKSTGKR